MRSRGKTWQQPCENAPLTHGVPASTMQLKPGSNELNVISKILELGTVRALFDHHSWYLASVSGQAPILDSRCRWVLRDRLVQVTVQALQTQTRIFTNESLILSQVEKSLLYMVDMNRTKQEPNTSHLIYQSESTTSVQPGDWILKPLHLLKPIEILQTSRIRQCPARLHCLARHDTLDRYFNFFPI